MFLIAGAALAVAASCTKTQIETPDQEITFQVASYKVTTKADPADYKTGYENVPFGTYAWYKGVSASDNTTFMTDQKVSYNSGKAAWVPEGTTYYWPKTGSIDFISYSPFAAPKPTIDESSIAYPSWNVNANPTVDVMYADKAPGQTKNVSTYNYSGVPTLFHHALAKVSFQIKAAYLEKTADTGDKTRWEITVNSVTLKDILTTGTFALTLNADGKTWDHPATWTCAADKTDLTMDVSALTQLTTAPQALDANILVIPQPLNASQKVVLNITIKTYRDQNDGNGEKLVLTETNVPVEAVLSNGTLANWGVNQNITYTFNLAPSYGTGTGNDLDGDGIEDVVPTEVWFDPAVVDWENVTVSAGINV